eukprot:TRINITY_DN25617_c0_g1_i1.p1 TRINITY_DN25617_c0_g1~~TRINITY_DN25617_c0_g1_i1.p1  ORF type:complete len:451 (-),score=94.11 TRINITY_DN25617_c0_g1_i1:68-1420(-)
MEFLGKVDQPRSQDSLPPAECADGSAHSNSLACEKTPSDSGVWSNAEGSSLGSSGHGAGQQDANFNGNLRHVALKELLVRLPKALREIMRQTSERYGLEMGALRKELKDALRTRSTDGRGHSSVLSEVARLEAQKAEDGTSRKATIEPAETQSVTKGLEMLVASLRSELRGALEECDARTRALESIEAQHSRQLHALDAEFSTEVADLKQRHSAQLAAHKRQFESRLTYLKTQATENKDQAADVSLANLFRQLCPSRKMSAEAAALGAAKTQGGGVGHLQDTCWRVLNLVPKNIALRCDFPSFSILEASREAGVVWGSAEALEGRKAPSLLRERSRASWLQRAVLTHHDLAQMQGGFEKVVGFAVHTLGRMAFCDAAGVAFDGVVTIAHMPAEVDLGHGACLIVVVDIPNQPNVQRQTTPVGSFGGGASDNKSVISDVSPSDSVSQIDWR